MILEGLDRTGKTSVAMALRRLLPGWGYVHHTNPPMEPFGYFGRFAAYARPEVVVDRLHWSEQAYGLAYRGESRLTSHQWRLLELVLLAQRAVVVHLTDELAAILSRYGPQEMWPKEGIEQVYNAYQALASGAGHPHQTHLPVHSYTLPQLLDGPVPTEELLVMAIEHRKLIRGQAQLPPSVAIGRLQRQGFMVLGEAQADQMSKEVMAGPLLPWGHGPAAEWLWQSLDAIGVRWWEGHYTNASAFSSAKDLCQYVEHPAHCPRVIICLGAVASSLAKATQLPRHRVHDLPHPMYARRFHYHCPEAYQDLLQEALQPWVG